MNKTLSLGILAILTSVLHIVQLAVAGHVDQIDWPSLIAAISSGWGLIHAGDASRSAPATVFTGTAAGAAPIIPPDAVAQVSQGMKSGLLLLVAFPLLFLSGCLNDRAQLDASRDAQAVFNDAEAMRRTLGVADFFALPAGAQPTLHTPPTRDDVLALQIADLKQQAVALGAVLGHSISTAPVH